MRIEELFDRRRFIILDGGMGTQLQQRGLQPGQLPELAAFTMPRTLEDIHRDYAAAGADVLLANTFGINEKKLEGSGYRVEQAVAASVACARRAAAPSGALVALDIGPLGELLQPAGSLSFAEACRRFSVVVRAGAAAGADLIVIETMTDLYELKAALLAAKENSSLPVLASMSFESRGRTFTGCTVESFGITAAGLGAAAVGINCSLGPAEILPFAKRLCRVVPAGVPVFVKPNAGLPNPDGSYDLDAEGFAAAMQAYAASGVSIVGGCCGTTPEYICRIAEELTRDGEPGNVPDAGQTKAAARHEDRPAQSGAEEAGGEERKPVPVKIRPSTDKKEKAGKVPAANTFREKLERGEPVVAVELDPPFDADMEKLLRGGLDLRGTPADIITLADSPLARSRADSLLTAVKLQQETGMAVMPHLACRDRNRIALRSGLLGAYLNEIRNILIVTGDPVGRDERAFTKSVFDFNSIKLMEFLTSLNEELFPEDPLFYGGALNQNGARPDKIAERMKRKIDAGCQFFLTQPVYSEEEIARLDWMKQETGARILIGIMPLVSHRNALFIKNEMPGIHVPDEVLAQYAPEGNREEWEQTAISICRRVIDMGRDVGAGYYFMTPFHRVKLIRQIMEDSGLSAERRGTAGRMDGRQ